jgi:hypothetical protein
VADVQPRASCACRAAMRGRARRAVALHSSPDQFGEADGLASSQCNGGSGRRRSRDRRDGSGWRRARCRGWWIRRCCTAIAARCRRW